MTGLFLAFDRFPNSRLARAKLNAAAETGHDVTVWIARLEAAMQQRKGKSHTADNEKSLKESLLGKWSVKVQKGPEMVLEFLRGGKGKIYVFGRVNPTKWVEQSSGVFRVTTQRGRTAVVNLAGDRIFGRWQDGKAYRGTRQAE